MCLAPGLTHRVDRLGAVPGLGVQAVHVAGHDAVGRAIARPRRAVHGLQGQTMYRHLTALPEIHHLDVLALPPGDVDVVLGGEVEGVDHSSIGLAIAVPVVVHLPEAGRRMDVGDVDGVDGGPVVGEHHHGGAVATAPRPGVVLPEVGEAHHVRVDRPEIVDGDHRHLGHDLEGHAPRLGGGDALLGHGRLHRGGLGDLSRFETLDRRGEFLNGAQDLAVPLLALGETGVDLLSTTLRLGHADRHDAVSDDCLRGVAGLARRLDLVEREGLIGVGRGGKGEKGHDGQKGEEELVHRNLRG